MKRMSHDRIASLIKRDTKNRNNILNKLTSLATSTKMTIDNDAVYQRKSNEISVEDVSECQKFVQRFPMTPPINRESLVPLVNYLKKGSTNNENWRYPVRTSHS